MAVDWERDYGATPHVVETLKNLQIYDGKTLLNVPDQQLLAVINFGSKSMADVRRMRAILRVEARLDGVTPKDWGERLKQIGARIENLSASTEKRISLIANAVDYARGIAEGAASRARTADSTARKVAKQVNGNQHKPKTRQPKIDTFRREVIQPAKKLARGLLKLSGIRHA